MSPTRSVSQVVSDFAGRSRHSAVASCPRSSVSATTSSPTTVRAKKIPHYLRFAFSRTLLNRVRDSSGPLHWKHSWVYDFETLRMMVRRQLAEGGALRIGLRAQHLHLPRRDLVG